MLRQLHRLLSGVRRRQRWQRSGDGIMCGVVVGSLIGLALEIARLLNAPIAPMTAWVTLLMCAVGGGLVGFALPISWRSPARMVDRHYGLKDRALTALEFATRSNDNPLVRLQVEEAIEHLNRVEPRSVLPRRMPSYTPAAVASSVCLLGLWLVPSHVQSPGVVDTAVQQVVRDQADNLEDTVVEELRDLAEEVPEPELQELANEIEKLVEELKSPDVNQREALSKLSEMQQQMAAVLDQFNAEKTDADLKELASALEAAESMQGIAEALEQGEYDKAAEKLEKIEASSMTRKEREAVAANLKKLQEKLQEKLGDDKQGELSDSVKEMEEGIEKQNDSQLKKGASKAAGVCKSQGLKKTISQCLNFQLNRLAECKSQCQNPGQSKSEGPAKKTDSPSNKAGKAASNQPLGDEATKIDAQRHQENLTGIKGDGTSERETRQSPEGEQDATRSYAARYTEFRKQMEQVLESEPLPLGHRETVRKYFESIRPTSSELSETMKE